MKALDRAGSLFLRSILKRMKALGLNQSALARRMNVSRAYVSKVFAGDVNISFQTACRFAKALEMDFMPGLAPKKESGARQGVRGIVAAVFCALAFACQAEVFSVPSWLPEDQRFEVSGTSNEIAQVEQTLAAMRDAFHPKLIEMMRRGDSATNGCPSAMGPTLEWIVHVSLPNVTNETAYFESYRKPLTPSTFDFNLLMNRAARLSIVPPMVRLSLLYDDGKSYSVSRPVPGVDYPGVSYEDEGTEPHCVKLVLRAPKERRHFRALAEVEPPDACDEYKFKWMFSKKIYVPHIRRARDCSAKSEVLDFTLFFSGLKRAGRTDSLVFAYSKNGKGVWPCPARIRLSADEYSVRTNTEGLLYSSDYGEFCDYYNYDAQANVTGFTRNKKGEFRGDEYSHLGERIIDSYADDRPRTTHKVQYAVKNGMLTFEDVGGDIHHKNIAPEYQSAKW